MKSLQLLFNSVVKFAKGIFVIHLILFASLLIIQSCQKSDTFERDNAAENFLSALKKHQKGIGAISAKPGGAYLQRSGSGNMQRGNMSLQGFETHREIHITFDEMPINPDYSYDINGMANLINSYDGVVSYEPTTNSFSFLVSEPEVKTSLASLITEARAYLIARGFTQADIDIMVQEEGGQEVDLVPFVAVLAEYENSGGTASNHFSTLLGTPAYARGAGECAAVALGVDAIWALSGSNARRWSRSSIRTAFRAVASRALGPVGVAIAVVTFGLCIGDVLP